MKIDIAKYLETYVNGLIYTEYLNKAMIYLYEK